MGIFNLIQSDPEMIRLIQEAVFNTIKIYGRSTLESQKPFLKSKDLEFEVVIVGILQLRGVNGEDKLALGISEAAFIGIYENMFQEKITGVSCENQDLAGELINIVYQSIDPELRQRGHRYDVSLPKIVTGSQLKNWSKISAARSLVFPFKTDSGDLFLEIPELK